jgi:integrative and conjugative element protein (TIGR02256 family)
VDATTSLDVPRAISLEAKAPRSASIFLTPNANASVLMLEDRDRTLRLDQIEPQYYRAVVNEDWGRHHLEGNLSEFWVGAGCRDISATISPENIQIHSALLSRRLRSSVDVPDAALLVHHTEADGSIQSLRTNLRPSWRREFGDWTVLIDEGLLDAAREIRRGALPSETGGVLLGSVDHYRRTIAMISALKPPPDSEGTPASFERGTQDLKETIAEANRRTAGIARYVGEWHSHPPRAPALMSGDDLHQLLHLAIHLASDGDPAVMLIIGDNDWSLYVGRAIA